MCNGTYYETHSESKISKNDILLVSLNNEIFFASTIANALDEAYAPIQFITNLSTCKINTPKLQAVKLASGEYCNCIIDCNQQVNVGDIVYGLTVNNRPIKAQIANVKINTKNAKFKAFKTISKKVSTSKQMYCKIPFVNETDIIYDISNNQVTFSEYINLNDKSKILYITDSTKQLKYFKCDLKSLVYFNNIDIGDTIAYYNTELCNYFTSKLHFSDAIGFYFTENLSSSNLNDLLDDFRSKCYIIKHWSSSGHIKFERAPGIKILERR